MRINEDSYGVTTLRRDYESMNNFTTDVDMRDKAHKRAKRELRKQQKALAKKNECIKYYKEMHDSCVKHYRWLERLLIDVQAKRSQETEEKISQSNDISNLELKVTCLEQENKTLRKEHSKCETEVLGRIIQSMNNTIVELREQLTETEEKYNELLKHIANEK